MKVPAAIFRLVSPREAAAVARALEAASGNQRSLILAALNAGQLTVHILPDFPADVVQSDSRNAPYLKKLYGGYAYMLEGRSFQIQAKGDAAPFDRLRFLS